MQGMRIVFVIFPPVRALRLESEFLAIDLMAYAIHLVPQRIRESRDDFELFPRVRVRQASPLREDLPARKRSVHLAHETSLYGAPFALRPAVRQFLRVMLSSRRLRTSLQLDGLYVAHRSR